MDVVTLSSNGKITLPSKRCETFSLSDGDSLVIVEEKDSIHLKPLINISHLWGVDSMVDTKSALKEFRDEWNKDLVE
ncbi:Transcriptional regulator AbrB [Methanospirillum hungatei JF-1]|uniref:Transcriptional regulator AbrB n=1 Tax=Methanospirillum hungatei JF-1 (strain ATCC 27890 / DSM 864 / NBRC 100397 / JF-1) TaxID=323259 RepID=Q2FPT0_METHJ|nr:AbrB/MazE/SpoVT family DNA-binding domain-containing protein [Methanospirillum hungatei]ABD39974.1 Transcriptional regulator AbrB [Methanospirillum hungatei JF-1]